MLLCSCLCIFASLEKYGWVRVLVEGNHGYRQRLLQNSPLAYSANAVLCEKHAIMHYANIGIRANITVKII